MSEGPDNLQKLLDFLEKLEEHHIFFRLDQCRREAIMVRIDVPGERWEVEFMSDGSIETEVFRSDGEIASGENSFDRLFRKFSD
jgi:hypothetical protein